ncbi:MAG: SHOCT domain-containing protein [Desulfobacterales bacterium]
MMDKRPKKRLQWILFLFVMNCIYANPVCANSGRYDDWHHHWMMGDWGIGWLGMVLMIVFWVLVVVGIVLLIKYMVQSGSNRSNAGVDSRPKAMEILKERYARGEITRDEFESIKKDILR